MHNQTSSKEQKIINSMRVSNGKVVWKWDGEFVSDPVNRVETITTQSWESKWLQEDLEECVLEEALGGLTEVEIPKKEAFQEVLKKEAIETKFEEQQEDENSEKVQCFDEEKRETIVLAGASQRSRNWAMAVRENYKDGVQGILWQGDERGEDPKDQNEKMTTKNEPQEVHGLELGTENQKENEIQEDVDFEEKKHYGICKKNSQEQMRWAQEQVQRADRFQWTALGIMILLLMGAGGVMGIALETQSSDLQALVGALSWMMMLVFWRVYEEKTPLKKMLEEQGIKWTWNRDWRVMRVLKEVSMGYGMSIDQDEEVQIEKLVTRSDAAKIAWMWSRKLKQPLTQWDAWWVKERMKDLNEKENNNVK